MRRSTDSLKLETFLHTCPVGAILTYADIAEATGVPMDKRGRGILRLACQRLDLEYLTRFNQGIELPSPVNCVEILEDRVIKIDHAASRAEVSYDRLKKFHPMLSEPDRQQALYLGTVLGAMRAAADTFRARALRRQQERRVLSMPS